MGRALLVAVLGLAAGCTVAVQPSAAVSDLPTALPSDVFSTLKDPADAHAELCEHDGSDTTFPEFEDRITNRFCQDVQGGTVPEPHSLDDLLNVLDLGFADPTGSNGVGGNPAFAILGHSSALTAREVSSITPTAFVFTPLLAGGVLPADYMFLAYDPGESFVEVASYSPSGQGVNFYIVMFDKDCTTSATGCTPNDMLTPAQTKGWSNVRIYESTTALNNTIADCRQCHIGTGQDRGDGNPATSPLILRMQEIEAPHTHWFSTATAGGSQLLSDFHAAHGTDEDYGGIPGRHDRSIGSGSDGGVHHDGGIRHAAERVSVGADRERGHRVGAAAARGQRADRRERDLADDPPGVGVRASYIPVPYHDVKVTDPDKLAEMTELYADCRNKVIPDLPEDIRDVLLPDALANMGFSPDPGADGNAILVEQCQECHNSHLDPALSRQNFLVDQLDQMSRSEKDLAITRINTPTNTRLTMPPPLFRLPSAADRAAMIAVLQK